MGWDNLRGAFGNRDVKTKIFNSPESHGYEQGNDPPLEPKFSMNDKGSQVKTPGQYANATNGKSPTGMNPMPVPGPTSAGVGRAG